MQEYQIKVIDGTDGKYTIDTDGVVRNSKTGKIKSTIITNKGYVQVVLCSKTFRVHRLVAQAFIPNPSNLPEIDHINEMKNDNRVCNLRWCTPDQNREFYWKKYHRGLVNKIIRENRQEIASTKAEARKLTQEARVEKEEAYRATQKAKLELQKINTAIKEAKAHYETTVRLTSSLKKDADKYTKHCLGKIDKEATYQEKRLNNVLLGYTFSVKYPIDGITERLDRNPTVVDGMVFSSVSSAGKYIATVEDAHVETIRKELRKYMSGKCKINKVKGHTVGY